MSRRVADRGQKRSRHDISVSMDDDGDGPPPRNNPKLVKVEKNRRFGRPLNASTSRAKVTGAPTEPKDYVGDILSDSNNVLRRKRITVPEPEPEPPRERSSADVRACASAPRIDVRASGRSRTRTPEAVVPPPNSPLRSPVIVKEEVIDVDDYGVADFALNPLFEWDRRALESDSPPFGSASSVSGASTETDDQRKAENYGEKCARAPSGRRETVNPTAPAADDRERSSEWRQPLERGSDPHRERHRPPESALPGPRDRYFSAKSKFAPSKSFPPQPQPMALMDLTQPPPQPISIMDLTQPPPQPQPLPPSFFKNQQPPYSFMNQQVMQHTSAAQFVVNFPSHYYPSNPGAPPPGFFPAHEPRPLKHLTSVQQQPLPPLPPVKNISGIVMSLVSTYGSMAITELLKHVRAISTDDYDHLLRFVNDCHAKALAATI